ncbi:hypothetical protein I4U23_011826 [Adineta vaga]|nr:hypothetical protein I4U23_011826 [Adineta vaga]
MQYAQGSEKVLVPGTVPILLTDDREVQRTRKILLIIFGILLGLNILSIAVFIINSTTTTSTSTTASAYYLKQNRTYTFTQPVLSAIFYALAFYVTYNYHPTGLRVVAWLLIIATVLLCLSFSLFSILFIIIISGVPIHEQLDSYVTVSGVIITVLGIIVAVSLVIQIILIKLCFKLARLINANKKVSIPQV